MQNAESERVGMPGASTEERPRRHEGGEGAGVSAGGRA